MSLHRSVPQSSLSWSFHLSTGKHLLTTCRKVSGASKHNLRKYESEEYNRTQIAILRGGDTNILTKVWRTFRAWWDKNKKPEVEKTARESVLKKLQRHKQEETEQPVNDKKVYRKKDQYR